MKVKKDDFIVNEYHLEYSKKVRSISEFLDLVDFINSTFFDSIWFRGHSNKIFKLVPTFTRLSTSKSTENHLIQSFISRGRTIIPREINSLWDIYQIMQHYGCPTRLLDWTESALISMFFALDNKSTDGCIWLLEPEILNISTNGGFGVYYPDKVFIEDDLELISSYLSENKESIPDKPLAFEAKWIDSRMSNQQCCFTIHGFEPRSFEKLFAAKEIIILCKIVIDKDSKEQMKLELERSGINEFIVYPNLEGLSRHLKHILF